MAIKNPTAAAPYVAGTVASSLARVSFRIQSKGAATNAPDNVIPAGACTTTTHASTGVYTLVIPNFLKLGTLVSASAQVLGAASSATDGRDLRIVSYAASTGVLTVHAYSSGADTDDDDGAYTAVTSPALAAVKDDDWMMFDLVFAQDVGSEGTSTAIA
jgi:hypothetical protein